MTSPAYEPFITDAGCYTDGHLSQSGADWVMTDVQRHLTALDSGAAVAPLFDSSIKFACTGKPGAGSGYDRALTASEAPR